jgi:hypothetical protein
MTNGMRQCAEAADAQVHRTFEVFYRHVHYTGSRPAIITTDALVGVEMDKHQNWPLDEVCS